MCVLHEENENRYLLWGFTYLLLLFVVVLLLNMLIAMFSRSFDMMVRAPPPRLAADCGPDACASAACALAVCAHCMLSPAVSNLLAASSRPAAVRFDDDSRADALC